MSTDKLSRAELIPYDAGGKKLENTEKIILDFNPESLTIKVDSGQAPRGKKGRQQVQHVGNAVATLSFDAIFDSTRPKEPAAGERDQAGEGTQGAEQFDVRRKTAKIANLLQKEGKGKKSAPRRVRFSWGAVQFDGIVKSFSETIDYFAPEGVPLRSKVSISITEQKFRYEVKAEHLPSQRQKAQPGKHEKDVARKNERESTPETKKGSGAEYDDALDLGLPPPDPLESLPQLAEEKLAGELGLGVDLAAAAGAGIELSAGSALELFGGAALEAGLDVDVDFGLAFRGIAATIEAGRSLDGNTTGVATPASTWALDGPRPGTRSAELAAQVNAARSSGAVEREPRHRGGEFSATALASVAPSASSPRDMAAIERYAEASDPSSVPPDRKPPSLPPRGETKLLPVRGSPPPKTTLFGPEQPAGPFSRKRRVRPEEVSEADRRPSWERLPQPAGTPTMAVQDPGSSRSSRSSRSCCRGQGKAEGQTW
jgi:hypothetical protein